MPPTATAPVTLVDIEALAKEYRGARDTLKERVTSFQEELTALRNRRLPGIKSAVAAAKDAESHVERAVAAGRELFGDPRTVTAHGIRFGIIKAKGKIAWENVKRVIELIEEKFAEKKDVLIKTTKKPVKKALQALTVGDLKRIGCTVSADADVVLVKAVDDEVDKLVAALLDEPAGDDDGDE